MKPRHFCRNTYTTMHEPKNISEIPEGEKIINVETIYKSFQVNMESVHFYFTKFGNLASGEDENIISNNNIFFEEVFEELHSEVERLKNKRVNPEDENEKVDPDEQTRILFKRITRKASKQSKISPKNFEILSRGSFIMLNNYFEYLLVDLLTHFYKKFQSSLSAKEFKVSLQELSEYETINEITNHLILKEVESILVEKTFDQLLDHFEKVLNVSLENEIINWDKIIELRERRHLIVHNSSVINKKYISRTKNPYNFKIGDTVHITNDYFVESFKNLDLAGKILCFNSWGSWDSENSTKAIEQIMLASFDSLIKKDLEITLKFCKYADQIKARNPEQQDFLLRTQINKAIALKKLNKKGELTKLLKVLPIGTASPVFKVAFQILEDNHNDLVDNFKKAIIVDNLIIDQYLEWPIFDLIREDEELNTKLISQFDQ